MSNETDARIIEQFKPTLEMVSQLAQDDQESLLSSAYLALAAIIVLDPFPRNIFRGQKQAFDYDVTISASENVSAKRDHEKFR